jgi:hypothetical protein
MRARPPLTCVASPTGSTSSPTPTCHRCRLACASWSPRSGGDEATRRAAVDALVRQLRPSESGGEVYSFQYGSPLFGPQVGCVAVQVYTTINPEGGSQ